MFFLNAANLTPLFYKKLIPFNQLNAREETWKFSRRDTEVMLENLQTLKYLATSQNETLAF